MIRWFARNDIAANFLLFGILIWGVWSAKEKIPLEVQPGIKFNEVHINVPYRGGSPDDVESAVVVPIEQALEGLPGVDMIISNAWTGSGRVIVRAGEGGKVDELLDEVKARVAMVSTFPQETEPPRIAIPDTSTWHDVIKVAITGDMDPVDLLRAARRVAEEVKSIRGISQARVQGAAALEVSVEADPSRLRHYGLTLSDLSAAIQRSSLDLPAGQIQTDEGTLMIRTKGQAYVRSDFETISVRNENGAEVKLKNVATVHDGFVENQKILRFNGKPCLMVEVLRLGNENALDIADAVRDYAATSAQRFPEGIELNVWDDSSEELRGRLGTLQTSLWQGAILVMIALGLFLRPMIAFWVLLGIPVSFAGALIMMPHFGISANVMSLFGFIIAVGIVVDDAIVTADNIYSKLRDKIEPLIAVTEGAREVTVPVTFGVLTTVVAFIPLMFFDGFYGSFTKQIPPIVSSVLIFSLIETKLILPSHLKHVRVGRTRMNFFERFQRSIANGLESFVERFYQPTLKITTQHRYVTLALFVAAGLCSFAYIKSGRMGFVSMPSIERNRINARIQMPRDTPVEETDARVKYVAGFVDQLRQDFVDPGTGESLIGNVVTASGGWIGWSGIDSRTGYVTIAVMDPGLRSEPGPKNTEIAKRWTELVGEMNDVESFWISGERGGGFGSDNELQSLSVEVRGPAGEDKEAAVKEIQETLEAYAGIASAWNNAGGNRDELIINIRPEGEALGLTQRELGRQVRAAFFGEEAQRILRQRDDIRVMVRLPLEKRQSLDTLNQLRIRTPSGGAAPFYSVANANFTKARSDIARIDGAQVVTVSAQPVDETVDVVAISRSFAHQLDALLNHHPELSWRYAGYVADHEQTRQRLVYGGVGLFLGLYALLAVPFRSLYQPFFVMLAIPFGIIGALFGHIIMDITPSYLSVFGILALSGVVVNDSLVMVDFINQKVRSGADLFESVIQSGTQRFRAIFLTSLTTFVGLVPLLFDRSLQAQILIPMATSLAFGILFATAITLYLVPAAYVATEDLMSPLRRAWRWYRKPFQQPIEVEDHPEAGIN